MKNKYIIITKKMSTTSPSSPTTLSSLSQFHSMIKQMDDQVNDTYMFNDPTNTYLAPWQPTILEEFLLATKCWFIMDTENNNIFLDLGCGDGRVVIFACKILQCKFGIGWDISPTCIEVAKQLSIIEQVQHYTEFNIVNFLSHNTNNNLIPENNPEIYNITIIYIYLLPEGLQKIQPLIVLLQNINHNKTTKIKLITNHYHFDMNNNIFQLLDTKGEFKLWQLI
jgi:SAM-dependent methyltransferase